MGTLIFCESIHPDRPSAFDAELDRAVVDLARRHGRLSGRCSVVGGPTEFELASENLREDLVATASRSINRQRRLIAGLAQAVLGQPGADPAEVAEELNRRT